MAGGGVTTHGFQVKEESRVKTKVPSSETPWVDQYPKRGSQLAVRAQWQTNQGRYNVVIRVKISVMFRMLDVKQRSL